MVETGEVEEEPLAFSAPPAPELIDTVPVE